MSWHVRHEGSPTATTVPSPQQVVEGLHEGVWEPIDEVRGPGETKWTPMEDHPVFEEAVAEYEAPRRAHHDDAHLDMNPLIDVALVLLIFFILTTSYDALKKVLDMPTMTAKGQQGPKVLDPNQLNDLIKVEGRIVDGKTIIKVDGQDVPEGQLRSAISKGVSEKRTKMVIDVKDVKWDTVIQIIEAGRGAGVAKFMMRVNQ